jgi:hypothetical protein
MSRAIRPTVLIGLLGLLVAASPVWAAAAAPAFTSPYASPETLEAFLVFSAPARQNIPDGQIHWVDAEVPGIDVRGPDGILRSMCPEDGLAWSLAEGDTVGGGGQFVAVECQGSAEGWQMLAFHLCEIQIQASISGSQRQYTRVPPGAPLARECSHTHLSLGYYARPEAKKETSCPQWYVQGRYWVNAACMARSLSLPAVLPAYLSLEEDWELRFLTPEMLEVWRRFALPVVLLALAGYVAFSFNRPASAARRTWPPQATSLAKTGIVLGLIGLLIIASAGPVWPVGSAGLTAYSPADAPYQAIARAVGYQDWRLLKAFFAVAVPRDSAGRPVAPGQAGKVFPPEAAAAIPFGETNAEEWGTIDPTRPGPYGAFRAWEAVTERWPVSFYERWLLRRTVSATAQKQRDGLTAIATSPSMQALGLSLGRVIRAEDIYGSSAGAVGRTQILPQYFAPGALCGDVASMDVWNDPLAVAECTTRYLTVSGCWGSWWANGDVWSALCGYNPGAWDVAEHEWYWAVLRDRMTRLAAASAQYRVAASGDSLAAPAEVRPAASALGAEHLVPTPVLGLMATQALLKNGQGAWAMPEPLAQLTAAAAPQVQTPERRAVVRTAYRLFRAWLLIYYSPEELLALGVQF